MNQVDNAQPHILLAFPEYFPNSFVEDVVADFNLPEELIKVHKVEPQTYAALEWSIPTLVAVYLGKTVFEAFIKETAKDYTPNLLAGIKALAKRCQQIRSQSVAATASKDKLNPDYRQSGVFSLVVETKSGRSLKLLFDEELSPQDWEDAIDGMLGTVASNYINHPNDPLSKSGVMAITKPGSPIYAVYNWEHKGWELHNDHTLLLQAQAKQSSKPSES